MYFLCGSILLTLMLVLWSRELRRQDRKALTVFNGLCSCGANRPAMTVSRNFGWRNVCDDCGSIDAEIGWKVIPFSAGCVVLEDEW